MPRFARLLSNALILAALPVSALAQSGGPAEPALERTMPSIANPAATAEPDPWLMAYVGLGGRTARVNLGQLDRALESYGTSYSRLTPDDRSRVRQSFDDLIPG